MYHWQLLLCYEVMSRNYVATYIPYQIKTISLLCFFFSFFFFPYHTCLAWEMHRRYINRSAFATLAAAVSLSTFDNSISFVGNGILASGYANCHQKGCRMAA